MNIICLSSQYLHALRKESKGYNFKFQGYSSISSACTGLTRVNGLDIYGFCVVADSLPEDKHLLRSFIRKCDLISLGGLLPKRIVFGLTDTTGLEDFLRSCNLSSLEPYLADFEILTDSIIRQQIFGTVLDGLLTSHKGKKAKYSVKIPSGIETLKFVPPFHPDLLLALSPVRVKDSISETFIEDKATNDLTNRGSFFQPFRVHVINSYFGLQENSLPSIQAIIDSSVNIQDRIKYELILDYITDRTGELFHENKPK